MVGWRAFGRAQPNAAHRTLATLEQQHRLSGLVTQNVDGLHQAAGSTDGWLGVIGGKPCQTTTAHQL